MLEDVSLWRFAPSPVHGCFTGRNVLATFDDEQDAGSGHVRGVVAWEESRVGDPADDFADLAARAAPDVFDSVLETYARSRVERPDGALVQRARLAAEMTPLRTLLRALSAGELGLVERTAERLRALDERIEQDDARHAREDATRSERSRRASERAAAVATLDPDDPESRAPPQPDSDATAAHQPFPMLAQTQAVSMAGLLTDDDGNGTDDRNDAGSGDGAGSGDDQPTSPSSGPVAPPATGVPYVASDDDGATFEIDEVEALPDDAGLVDVHEGASEFIRVQPASRDDAD